MMSIKLPHRSFAFQRLSTVTRCNIAAASTGPGCLQFAGAGKTGLVLFSGNNNSGTPAASTSTTPVAPQPASPGPGTLSYVGAGKSGQVSFSGSSAATTTKKSVKELLTMAGFAGLVAYGISNTLYYTAAFVMVWNLQKVPSGEGIAAAAQAAVKTLAVVWAGSQVTKVARIGAAVLAAPIVDRFLSLIMQKCELKTKRDAFFRVVFPVCIAFALSIFGAVVLLWM